MHHIVRPYTESQTYKVILLGIVAAFLMMAPTTELYLNLNWPWAHTFLIRSLNIMLSYVTIFFHELGHAAFGWFYGYISVPTFDLTHGGGMAYRLTGQLWPLHAAMSGCLLYMIYQTRQERGWAGLFAVVLLFHVCTAYTDAHEVMISFAGHLTELAIAGFMLVRAWLNRAPRGVFERFLNAAFGFGIAGSALVHSWAILHDPSVREGYLLQKDGHGFGDFDRVADMTGLPFNSVILIDATCAVLSLVVPIVLYSLRDTFDLSRQTDDPTY